MSERFKTNTRNAWCDCIRGYAILIVCISHLFFVEPIATHFGFGKYLIHGEVGVFMFYVLSGFLVTGILVREVEQHGEFAYRLRATGHFFARRIFRLQPSCLLFLACYAVFAAKHDALSWWVLLPPLSNWFAGPYITWHLKTLHIEEIYYIFIGICSGIFWRSLKSLLWTLLIFGPLGRVTLFLMMKAGYASAAWLSDRYLPVEAFAVGGLLVLYLERVQTFRIAKMIMQRPVASFGLAMLLLLISAALRPVKPFSYALLFTWPLLFSVCSAVMILSGLQKEQFFFSAEWLRKLGLVSYTVYLFQQFALGPWQPNFGTEFRWSAWGGVCVAVLILVPLWYRYVEKPTTDLGARLFPRLAKQVAITTS